MNKPFDQRVINHLERPTSSDLNIAQSQLNLGGRALMRQLLQPNPLAVGTGSLGESFFVEKIAGEDRKFKIKRGVGFNYAAENTALDIDIDGIVGLSDPFDYRMVTLQSEEGVEITVPAGPGAGLCRRDVIAIRCTNPSTNQLEDYGPTDIYDPPNNKFNTVSAPKTFSYDITGSVPQVLDYTQVGSATGAVLYIKGPVIPYTGPDSLLDAPFTSPGSKYISIAIINVVQAVAAVEQSDVVDFRRLVAPQGNLVVSGSATIGSVASSPGARLQDVTIKTPPGIKAQLWKVAEGTSNSYALVVYGPRTVTAASFTLQRGDIAAVYELLVDNYFGIADRPLLLVSGPQSINQGVTQSTQTLAASSSASPTQQVAIGQPYHVFPFTLCKVQNVTSTVTEPLTLSLDINPLVIPNPPAYPNQWPAGTYTASGGTATRTYYMNYDTGPTTPITGIPSPVYQLGTSPSATETSSSLSFDPAYTRIAGFLLPFDSQWQTFAGGVWRFSIFSKLMSGYGGVYYKAAAYIYNGTTNPEAGTPIGVVEDVPVSEIPRSAAYETDQRTDFYMAVNGTGFTAGRRVYIVLYAKWENIPPAPGDVFTVYYGGDKPAVVETNIPHSAQTTILPSPDPYPGGTYEITGSATSNPVTINVAGAEQRLNPATTGLETPINFTLNLTVN